MAKKITEDMVVKAVEIFFTKDQNITPLIEMGMTESSAKGTIYCYAKLIKGEPFSRGIQQNVIKAILKKLYENNDQGKLANVIAGLDKHFERRLNSKDKEKNNGAREIVDEYRDKLSVMDDKEISYPDEITDAEQEFSEGAKQRITVNKYERDPRARAECIRIHGHSCQVCEFDFEKVYGKIGKEYIHVHHLIPLKDIGEKYSPDPEKDLIPVCPNCHAMLHRLPDPSDVEGLKKRLDK